MHRLTPIARPFKSAQANKNLRPRRTWCSLLIVAARQVGNFCRKHITSSGTRGWPTPLARLMEHARNAHPSPPALITATSAFRIEEVIWIHEALLISESTQTSLSTGTVIAFMVERCVELYDAIVAKLITSFALRNSTQ